MRNAGLYICGIISLLICSCEKSGIAVQDVELLPEYGYIRFSTDVATKAPMIENLRNNNFGVMGYVYDSDWATARALEEPDLFYQELVSCDENGVCSYEGLEPWNVDKVYSFFGYYPYNGNGIVTSGKNDKNMPVVTYTLPLSTGSEVNPASMHDLMTAYSIDQTARGTGSVAFTFQHRLFCIEVISQNFNEDVAASGNSQGKDSDVKISDLKLKIDNIAWSSVTVPMQKGDSEPVKTEFTGGAVTFDLSGGGTVTVPSFDDSPNSVRVSGDEYVMLVPQDNSADGKELTGTVSFTLEDSDGSESKEIGFSSDLNFQEGKKYSVIINFTGETIVIIVAESGSWEPHSVNYDFE